MATTGRNNAHLSWQMLVVAAVTVAFLYATGQLTAPFLQHDDWPYLLSASQQGGTSLAWTNTLAEGRWVNYLWYLVSQHFSALTANALYTAAYIACSGAVALLVPDRRLFLLSALALFTSPMFAELSLWPTSGFSGVALCGAAIFALVTLDERYTLPTLAVATFVLVLAYPPLASIVLLGAAARQTRPTAQSTLSLAIAFLIAFAMSVLLAYSLNAAFHGHFGVAIKPWRNPHPLHGLSGLGLNLRLAAANWHAAVLRFQWPVACAVIAGGLLLLRAETCARGLALILALAICWCVDVGITVIAGVGNPDRSDAWLWVAACLLCAIAASQRSSIQRYVGITLLAVLTVSGGLFTWHNYRRYQPMVAYLATLDHTVRGYHDSTGHTTITLAGSLARVPGIWMLGDGGWPSLQWILRKQDGVHLQRCDYTTCVGARQYLLAHHVQGPALLQLDDRPILALNSGAIDELLRVYPSAQQEAALHLDYPIILRYGPRSARIAPFFPGTSPIPASVALPAQQRGYSLHGEGNECAYPIQYQLTDSHGALVATGQYRPPAPLVIPQSARRREVSILSLRMAQGARNNFKCNIVVAPNS